MIHGHKRLITVLFLSALLALTLLIVQIKKSFSLTVKQVDTPLVSPEAIDIPLDQTEAVLGNPGADVTIVAFLDFGSSKDRKLYKTLVTLTRANPKKLRLILKPATSESFIFESTHNTIEEALACASLQKKQWAYADALSDIGTLWRLTQLTNAAQTAGLDLDQFKACQTYGTAKAPLSNALEISKKIAPNPPAIFANNKRLNLVGGVDINDLVQAFISPQL